MGPFWDRFVHPFLEVVGVKGVCTQFQNVVGSEGIYPFPLWLEAEGIHNPGLNCDFRSKFPLNSLGRKFLDPREDPNKGLI